MELYTLSLAAYNTKIDINGLNSVFMVSINILWNIKYANKFIN